MGVTMIVLDGGFILLYTGMKQYTMMYNFPPTFIHTPETSKANTTFIHKYRCIPSVLSAKEEREKQSCPSNEYGFTVSIMRTLIDRDLQTTARARTRLWTPKQT